MCWHGAELTLVRNYSSCAFGFTFFVSKEDALFGFSDYFLISWFIEELVGEFLIFLKQLHIVLFFIFQICFLVSYCFLKHDKFDLGVLFPLCLFFSLFKLSLFSVFQSLLSFINWISFGAEIRKETVCLRMAVIWHFFLINYSQYVTRTKRIKDKYKD